MPFPLTWPHALFVMAFGLFGSSNRGAASGSQVTPTGFGARSAFGDGSGTRDGIFLGNGLTNGVNGRLVVRMGGQLAPGVVDIGVPG
ncbi:hypothetical protein [Saccharopolyspora hattusasensis]|uniref:hypothetical protein n=1 Tax=Saccharopolyspora hattusasensis TaxID=1128679 RepID=UPI003D966F13